jgi:hypothetical protein
MDMMMIGGLAVAFLAGFGSAVGFLRWCNSDD